jgi:hypothetical protein
MIVTNSIMNPFWAAAICTATQECPDTLWNPKVHYRVHKNFSLVLVLSQINPIYITPSYLSISYFYIRILQVFFNTHVCYMSFSTHPPVFHYSNCTWRRVQIMNFLLCQLQGVPSNAGCKQPNLRFLLCSFLLLLQSSVEHINYYVDILHLSAQDRKCKNGEYLDTYRNLWFS